VVGEFGDAGGRFEGVSGEEGGEVVMTGGGGYRGCWGVRRCLWGFGTGFAGRGRKQGRCGFSQRGVEMGEEGNEGALTGRRFDLVKRAGHDSHPGAHR